MYNFYKKKSVTVLLGELVGIFTRLESNFWIHLQFLSPKKEHISNIICFALDDAIKQKSLLTKFKYWVKDMNKRQISVGDILLIQR